MNQISQTGNVKQRTMKSSRKESDEPKKQRLIARYAKVSRCCSLKRKTVKDSLDVPMKIAKPSCHYQNKAESRF